jgi:hypothetical protein
MCLQEEEGRKGRRQEGRFYIYICGSLNFAGKK